MSFAGQVKEELRKNIEASRQGKLAEIAAITYLAGQIVIKGSERGIFLRAENLSVVRKYAILVRQAFQIKAAEEEEKIRLEDGKMYVRILQDSREMTSLLMAIRFLDAKGKPTKEDTVSDVLLREDSARRAFLRDAFLCVGSMSDPEKSYQLEFVCDRRQQADLIRQLLTEYDLEGKTVRRQNYHVVYLKEGEAITTLLALMGAGQSLMQMENRRIVREMRSQVNRRVNCETANIGKVVSAAARQVSDIEYIRDHGGLEILDEKLREMARVRLERPDLSLQELGGLLNPPVGKSGVNHRLRRLSHLADQMREKMAVSKDL